MKEPGLKKFDPALGVSVDLRKKVEVFKEKMMGSGVSAGRVAGGGQKEEGKFFDLLNVMVDTSCVLRMEGKGENGIEEMQREMQREKERLMAGARRLRV